MGFMDQQEFIVGSVDDLVGCLGPYGLNCNKMNNVAILQYTLTSVATKNDKGQCKVNSVYIVNYNFKVRVYSNLL